MKKYYLPLLVLLVFVSGSKLAFAAKPSDFGLKDGDLISAIFSDDPDVYIINEQGYKRLFLNPEIFKFYGHLGGFFNVKLVTKDVVNAFPTSGLFRDCESNDPKVYGVDIGGEDTGQLHWVNTTGDQAVKDDPNFFKKVFCINNSEFNWYPKGSTLNTVKDVPDYERMGSGTVASPEVVTAHSSLKDVGKVIVCHHPPGNPSGVNTLTVDASALKAHLAEGDTVGECTGISTTPVPTPTPSATLTPTPSPNVSPTSTPIPSTSPTPTPATSVNPTPTQTPTPATLTIRGRMVNAVTNQPVTSTNMLIWNWKGNTRRDFYLKSDGTFEIQLTEDDIANASITYVNNVYINSQACYDQSQFSIQKISTGSVDYVRVQGPGGNYSGISTRTVQPINNVADIGDFLVWPVTGFSLVSDIPVKFTSKFANGSGGGGNSLYKTSHGFSTLYPLNTDTSIILTDQSGNQYTSPYVRYSLSQHCSQVTLNFASVASSQFSWSPPGEIATANPNSSFAANTFTRDLYFGLTGNDVKQLQALLANEVGYSADLITGYFGRITRDAVERLQEKYGIKPTYGYFGEITRNALRALISN